MKLYYFETPNPRKTCAMAKHLGVAVEHVRVDLSKGQNKSSDYLAINPNGKVPALQDGSLKLWEANAIMCYLAEKAGSELWPSNPLKRVEVMRWLSWDANHFSRHAGTLYFENMIKATFGMGAPDATAISEASGYFKRYAGVLDEQLSQQQYVAGDDLTIADFAVASFLPYAEGSNLPLEPFSNIQRWNIALNELPAWREPFPAAAAA